ncbi:ankyrin repeat-containing domain protein [Aspergillus pseudonomiae]|uniref:Ankyrin repeat-containing domain protein n=1 Tax=Aspergillus pseudonomiae TaxID=1506151 RepID=A0A5N7CSR3_9EURO|nr:ankyrin repeat-containing domain protein [Aspergillus pseudonomiae]KAE8397194.1 ankyrin repeat-containing domain protein [Aspergillus pseudonomiae]
MCNKPKIPGGLQLAIEKGLSYDVQRYLDEGTSPDLCDKKNKQSQGKPLLALAVINDQIRIIELLIKYGAKVDKKDSHGRTPLSWAAEHGAFQAVKLLIEHDANVNTEDKEWTTPLAWVVYAGTRDTQRMQDYLISKGARIEMRHTFFDTFIYLLATNFESGDMGF